MKLYKIILLALSMIMAACTAAAESTVETRIVGGTQVISDGTYPWMVLLSDSSYPSGFFCGGSLIDEKWVLTAAHCVVDVLYGGVYAFVGEYSKTDNILIDANLIDKIIVHPDYDAATSDNDIALLRLSTPSAVTPVNIITTGVATTLESVSGDFLDDVTVIGWGDTEDPVSPTYPNILREVDLPYISNTVCNESQYLDNEVTVNMMCAGVPAGGVDSCQGDSGGPLIYTLDNGVTWYQAGIVSWGYGCAEHNSFGVYTRVENYIDWIEKTKTVTPFLDFTTWVANKTVIRTVVIDNSTASAFSLVSAPSSSNSSIFQVVSNNCPVLINVGDTCSIDVQFVASLAGDYSETLTIQTDSALGNVAIPLTGRIASEFMYDFAGLEASLNWALGGDSNWYERNIMTNGYVLQSGDITDNQSSSVFTYVTVTDGDTRYLHFDWRVCSEEHFDFLQLWVDYKKIDALSGCVDWYRKTIKLSGDGDHIIEWRFNKDYTESVGDDAGWINNVSINGSPSSSSGGGAISTWFMFGLGIPLLLRRRFKH